MKRGDFIRVRSDHTNSTRAGKDGMVTSPPDGTGWVGLFFGTDRYNAPQGCHCVGTELWHVEELDAQTLETSTDQL